MSSVSRIFEPRPGLRLRPLWLATGWLLVGLTVYASLSSEPPGGPGLVNDKVAHALTYAVLGFWFAALYQRRSFALLAAGLFSLGLVLELLQARGGTRQGEFADLAANAAGIGVGILAGAWAEGRWMGWLDRRLASAIP